MKLVNAIFDGAVLFVSALQANPIGAAFAVAFAAIALTAYVIFVLASKL